MCVCTRVGACVHMRTDVCPASACPFRAGTWDASGARAPWSSHVATWMVSSVPMGRTGPSVPTRGLPSVPAPTSLGLWVLLGPVPLWQPSHGALLLGPKSTATGRACGWLPAAVGQSGYRRGTRGEGQCAQSWPEDPPAPSVKLRELRAPVGGPGSPASAPIPCC